MDTGLAGFWPMTQSLGPSLSAMGSSAPHPAAETRRRGTSRWSSVTQTGLEFHWKLLALCAPASAAPGRPHAVDSPGPAPPGQALPSLPLPAHFLTPTSPCSRRGAGRHQTRGGRRAEREEATLGSQRALSGLRRGRGVDI